MVNSYNITIIIIIIINLILTIIIIISTGLEMSGSSVPP